MRRKNWETMHSALANSLVRPDFKDPQSTAWLSFQWKLIVGEDLMSISQVGKLSTNTLFVTVSDKIWFPALETLRKKIICEINKRAGLTLVKRIIFQEGFVISATRGKISVNGKQNSMEYKKFEENKLMDEEESLRDIMDRISSKLRATSLLWILLVVSNCTTLPIDQSLKVIDLSGSYAVKTVEQLTKQKSVDPVQDPRAYYHYLMALKWVRGHQFEKAAGSFRGMIQYDSSDYRIHQHLALNLIRSGKVNEAYKVLEESLRHFPDNPELNMMTADILTGQKEYDKALTHYRDVIRVQPSSSRAYLLCGSIYEHLGQYDLAFDMYKQTTLVEPLNPLGHHYVARMNILSGNLKDAKTHLMEALELRPNLLQSREFLAWTFEKQGNIEEAEREYKLLLKLDPLNREIHKRIISMKDSTTPLDLDTAEYQLAAKELLGEPKPHMKIGAIYYEQAIYLKALDEFQLIKAKEQTKEILMVLGRIYEVLGRIDKAILEINNLIKIEPQLVNLMIYLARLYSLNEQPEETVRLIGEAVKIDTNNDTLYHSLALAYISTGQFDQAIGKMQKAISINNKKDSYYFELGALLERTGELELAIQNIKRSIELNPMHSNAHNFLGYMYAIQGKSLDKALGHLHKALSIQPKNGYFLDSLSWIYFKKGQPKKALNELKRAMVYTAPDPVLYSHLGDIHFSLENYLKAGNAWKTSLFLCM